jgi:hypothetical protein
VPAHRLDDFSRRADSRPATCGLAGPQMGLTGQTKISLDPGWTEGELPVTPRYRTAKWALFRVP